MIVRSSSHLVAFALLFILPLLAASSQGAPAGPPSCRADVDSLDAAVRRNYAGFVLEVRDAEERRRAYETMLAAARQEAASSEGDDCYETLRAFVEWFDDPHLFVYQYTSIDSATAQARHRARRSVDIGEAALRAALGRRVGALDPIEGIWTDGDMRLGVLADPDVEAGRFVAFLLDSAAPLWPAGAVRATMRRTERGDYETTLTNVSFSRRQLTAKLYKRVLLRFSPGTWGKLYPVVPADSAAIDHSDPRRPRVSVRERSVVFSIPSHIGQYRRVIDSLVDAHAVDIRARPLLVIDLRGNEGGGSQTTRALHPWIATRVRRATRYDSGAAVMLSSPAQVAYARRFTGTDTSAFVRGLVARLEASPGELVPFREDDSPARPDSTLAGPWRVAMLVDRGTVSAAEVMVLIGLRSTRTTVFGEPTAGALDYQSVNVVPLSRHERRWGLGYPTITAHADLPARGMRGHGIAPDVRIDWRAIPDPIAEVERRMLATVSPP